MLSREQILLNEFFSHVVTNAPSLELLLLNKEFGPFFSQVSWHQKWTPLELTVPSETVQCADSLV